MKKIPFWSQTHRNGILHQIQPLEERARRRRRSKKPELRRSPNQRQIKPSRHKSPALPPFQSLSVPPRIRSNPRERIKTLLPFLLSFVSLNKEQKEQIMVRDLDRYSGKGRGSGKQKPFKGVLQRRESEKRERGLGTYGCDFLFLNMTKISCGGFH